MRIILLIAGALSLLPVAAPRADGFDIRDWYDKAKSVAESLALETPPPHRGEAKVSAEAIDPKMALIPRNEGRMRVIPPPGSAGGDRRIEPR